MIVRIISWSNTNGVILDYPFRNLGSAGKRKLSLSLGLVSNFGSHLIRSLVEVQHY